MTFDQAKSASNRLKHGIDFIDAQAIWRDDTHVLVAARVGTAQRFIVVGRIDDKHWSAVVTYPGDLVRIISVRRSRDKQVQAYGSQRIR
ncbi:MAG: BrnT family toxin [Actinomycetota bacterium]